MSRLGSRALAVVGGLLLQKFLPEPPDRWHPVGWFGTVMQRAEDVGYADSRSAGVRHALTGALLGCVAGAITRSATGSPTGSTVGAVTLCAAGRELRRAALLIEGPLASGDLDSARSRLPALVGRDPRHLDESGIAAAVIESLAENSVDAVIAPACWGLALGTPGVLAHRAINTMDAMVGHHSERYEHFGWAAARLDDVANWVPARVFAGLVAVVAPRRSVQVIGLVRRDARRHPSPNSGVAETAVAAALGRELGGPLRYGDRHEDRPRLGDGPRPRRHDIRDARELTSQTEWALIGVLALVWWADRSIARTRRSR